MNLFQVADREEGLRPQEIEEAMARALSGRKVSRALIIPPDFTRLHSNAGFLTNVSYHLLTRAGARVDLLPALGTHEPMTREQIGVMFGDIPPERFIPHSWREDVVRLGEVPADFIGEVTEGLWRDSVAVEINRRVMDPGYDLILSPGQVVPHEVIGMSNHAKNLFVGVGGREMINSCHMIGALCGMERMMGRDHTPPRQIFDYSAERFLKDRPILYALTVNTAPGGHIRTHGLFIGEGRECLTQAVKLSQEKNIDFVDRSLKKCVVYLDPAEFRSTWLGNKAIYRTRMAMADGGELVVLAPGVTKFGEDPVADRLIRKYGYRGRLAVLEQFRRPESQDMRENMGAAAHLIHGSPDGRFTVTYGVREMDRREIEGVGFRSAGYDELVKRYDPEKLSYGFQTLPDGEEIYFVPNPALGLWINRKRFEAG